VKKEKEAQELVEIATKLAEQKIVARTSSIAIKRALRKLTRATKSHAFRFLDDFHLIDPIRIDTS
jgi:hypothetical protein